MHSNSSRFCGKIRNQHRNERLPTSTGGACSCRRGKFSECFVIIFVITAASPKWPLVAVRMPDRISHDWRLYAARTEPYGDVSGDLGYDLGHTVYCWGTTAPAVSVWVLSLLLCMLSILFVGIISGLFYFRETSTIHRSFSLRRESTFHCLFF